MTFAEALEAYHEKLTRCPPVIDVGFHIARHRPEGGRHARGPRQAAGRGRHLLQALHGLQGRRDGRRRDALQGDADRDETGGLVMVHAENGDAIDIIVKEAVAEGKTDPIWHARTPADGDGGGGDEPRDPARARRRRAALRRPRLVPAVRRADRARAREGLEGVGRDVHPVPLRRRVDDREAELGGREVHLHAAAAPEGAPGAPLEGDRHRRAVRGLDRPLPVQLARAEGDQRTRVPGRPERRPGDREPAPHALDVRRGRGPDHAEPLRRARLDEHREALRPLPAQGHDRAGLRRGHRRLGSRRRSSRSRRRPTTRTSTTTSSRARR